MSYWNSLLLFSHLVVSDRFAAPWTVAHQAPLFLGFPRQEYWSGLPFPPPRDLPNSGIKSMCPVSPALQADSLPVREVQSRSGADNFKF